MPEAPPHAVRTRFGLCSPRCHTALINRADVARAQRRPVPPRNPRPRHDHSHSLCACACRRDDVPSTVHRRMPAHAPRTSRSSPIKATPTSFAKPAAARSRICVRTGLPAISGSLTAQRRCRQNSPNPASPIAAPGPSASIRPDGWSAIPMSTWIIRIIRIEQEYSGLRRLLTRIGARISRNRGRHFVSGGASGPHGDVPRKCRERRQPLPGMSSGPVIVSMTA